MTYLSGILIYLFALVAVGVYKMRSVKNSEDFMVAGRDPALVYPGGNPVGNLDGQWIFIQRCWSGISKRSGRALVQRWRLVRNRPDLFYRPKDSQLWQGNSARYI